jgi:hypothetical protein
MTATLNDQQKACIRALQEHLDESNGLLVAMMHEKRSVAEIEEQVALNRIAIESAKDFLGNPSQHAAVGEAQTKPVAYRWRRRARDGWEYSTTATMIDEDIVRVLREDGFDAEWLVVVNEAKSTAPLTRASDAPATDKQHAGGLTNEQRDALDDAYEKGYVDGWKNGPFRRAAPTAKQCAAPSVGAHLWMPAEIPEPLEAPQDFGDRKAYAFKDPKAGEHAPWYVVLPNMNAVKLGYHADDSVDKAHAEFIASAINAALTAPTSAATAPAALTGERTSFLEWAKDWWFADEMAEPDANSAAWHAWQARALLATNPSNSADGGGSNAS